MKQLFNNRPTIAVLVIPGLLFMLFAMVVPIGFSVFYSMTDWQGMGDFNMINFQNYVEILTTDGTFYRSLINVIILMIVTIFLQNPLAFALAAILAHITNKFSRLLRTVYFVPAVLSVVVVVAMWANMMNPTYGIIDKFLGAIGLGAIATSWLSNPSTALGSVLFIILWQGFGWALLFYYTGLMTVPKELEEAAIVDGANWFTTYFKVIIPYLFPIISSVIVIDVISSMKQMEIIFLSTQGGPGDLTQFTAVYLYQKAFTAGQYGYGNALSVLFVIISVGLTLLVQRLFRSDSEIK